MNSFWEGATRYEIGKVTVSWPSIKCILKKHIYYDKTNFYKVLCVDVNNDISTFLCLMQ